MSEIIENSDSSSSSDSDDDEKSQDDKPKHTYLLMMNITLDMDAKLEDNASSFRHTMYDVSHSKYCQVILSTLLILDVLVLFIELYIDAEYPSCNVVEKFAISCCPAASDDEHHFLYRFLSGNENSHHELCLNGTETDYAATCDPHAKPGIHIAHTVLFSVSIVILSLFLVELNITLIALGPRVFFGNLLYTLDYFIVTISFVLEIVLRIQNSGAFASLVGFMVIFRLWRFMRIGHGLVEVARKRCKRKAHEQQKEIHHFEKLLVSNGINVPKYEKAGSHYSRKSES